MNYQLLIRRAKSNKAASLLLSIIGLVIVVFLVSQGVKYLSKALEGTPELYFNSQSYTINSGETQNVDFYINPAGVILGFTRIEVVFDKNLLRLTSNPQSHSVLSRIIDISTTAEANSSGKVVLVHGLDPSETTSGPPFHYRVATLSFTPNTSLSDQSTTLSFNEAGSQIVALDQSIKTVQANNSTVTINPTSATNTPVPTNTPTTGPTPTPGPTLPPPEPSPGIWISREEIMALPTSGSGWDHVLSEAQSSWGSADLSSNDSQHDVKTLAGALVAVRTADPGMYEKVLGGLDAAMSAPLSDRELEIARGLQSYVIAADIIDLKNVDPDRDSRFRSWVRMLMDADVTPHSGGPEACNSLSTKISSCRNDLDLGGIPCTTMVSLNNHAGHTRSSTIASALYLGDQDLLQKAADSHKAFIGLPVQNYFACKDTTWHADPNERYGINKKGAQRNGVYISGVLPEDWRRESYDFTWPAPRVVYMWEGMQGIVASAVMLHRAGLVDFNAGDKAVVRAMDMLYGTNESGFNEANTNDPVFHFPAGEGGDDAWIPCLVNFYAGTNFSDCAPSTGKGIGYADWTHQ